MMAALPNGCRLIVVGAQHARLVDFRGAPEEAQPGSAAGLPTIADIGLRVSRETSLREWVLGLTIGGATTDKCRI